MSMESFIKYLQELLSMIDEKDPFSIALAKAALTSTVGLAIASKKVDSLTRNTMVRAIATYDYLVRHANDYIGTPGDYQGNEKKRRRLQMMIQPGC